VKSFPHYICITLLNFILVIGCKEAQEVEFVENTDLKNKLQGKWFHLEEETDFFYYTIVRFQEETMHYLDSFGNYNHAEEKWEIKATTGNCPVLYAFNDGVQRYDPFEWEIPYWFKNIPENDILWIKTYEGSWVKIEDYEMTNNLITKIYETTMAPPDLTYIYSSYAIFSNSNNVVSFCFGGYGSGEYCVDYQKIY